MRTRFVGNDLAVVSPESRLDVLLIYLFFEDNEANIVVRVTWQERMVSSGVVEEKKRGKKKRVTVKVAVKKAYLEEDLEGVRLNGRVIECEEGQELKGRNLGVDIPIGEKVILEGEEGAVRRYLTTASGRRASGKVVLLLIDDREASVTLIDDLPVLLLEKNLGWHRSQGKEGSLELEKELDPLVSLSIKEAERHKARLIVASSSIFMKRLRRMIERRYSKGYFMDGPYLGSYYGALEVMRSREFRRLARGTLAAVQGRRMEMIKRGLILGGVEYGLIDVSRAVERSRAHMVVATTDFILSALEKDGDGLRGVVLKGLEKGVEVSVVSPKGELGKMVSSLGGVVAL